MKQPIYLEINGQIANIILNRPEKKNAISLEMFDQLGKIVDEIQQQENIKLVIVQGVNEKAFSAGADITEFLEVRFQPEEAKRYNDTALEAIDKLYRLPLPTIALIRTLAIGGGLELANACDFRFATSGAKLGITSANIGIVYNLASTKRLCQLVGYPKAKELLYSAKLIDAEEGLEIGLIDQVHPAAEIEAACDAFANTILKKSGVANTGIKQVIQAIIDGEKEESNDIAALILDSYQSEDYKEGIDAFLEKRTPQFK